MIKTDDSLDQLRIRKTTGISTALVQLQRQPARGGAFRRGQLPGVLHRRNLIQPGRVVPGFLHRRGVEDFVEHVFEYNTHQWSVIQYASDWLVSSGASPSSKPHLQGVSVEDWGAHDAALGDADRPG